MRNDIYLRLIFIIIEYRFWEFLLVPIVRYIQTWYAIFLKKKEFNLYFMSNFNELYLYK